MRKLIELCTDIATIGVWDPAHERPDLKTAKYNDFLSALEDEARAGRLFFINTGSDGGYPTEIYVDETPEAELLEVYTSIEREFLILSASGRLTAGGIEDFTSDPKQITSPQDELAVGVGKFVLKLYELQEEKADEKLRQTLGADDYDYYQKYWADLPWGCLLLVVVVVAYFLSPWYVSLGLFGIWMIFLIVRWRMRAADQRFQDIAARVKAHEERYPWLLFVLCRLADETDVIGGWYDLA